MKRKLQVGSVVTGLALGSGLWGQMLDLSGEWLESSDVRLVTGAFSAESELSGGLELRAEMTLISMELDYRPNPINFLGVARTREEESVGTRFRLRKEFDRWRIEGTGTFYQGYRSFSDAWLDEYYLQQYGANVLPGTHYEAIEPRGYGGTVAARWEYLKSTGYLSFGLGLIEDRIAPGYEIVDLGTSFELERGPQNLSTLLAYLSTENVVTKRIRMRHTFNLVDTSTRDVRLGWTGDLLIALGDHWVSRTSASYNHEDPTFMSRAVSQSIEYLMGGGWSIGLRGRYYEDSGQIESANLISSAAPALITRELSATVRWVGADEHWQVLFSGGPYRMRYAPTGIGTAEFVYLYADRNWTLFRSAVTYTF